METEGIGAEHHWSEEAEETRQPRFSPQSDGSASIECPRGGACVDEEAAAACSWGPRCGCAAASGRRGARAGCMSD